MVEGGETPLGSYYGEWVEISSPANMFSNTQLYTILINYFSLLGHTHSQSDVSNLSSALNNKQDTLTVSSASVTSLTTGSGSVNFTKYGKLVICDVYLYYTSGSNGNGTVNTKTFCSIPSGYLLSTRYTANVTVGTVGTGTQSFQPVEVFASTNGEIGANARIASTNHNIRCQLKWFTD